MHHKKLIAGLLALSFAVGYAMPRPVAQDEEEPTPPQVAMGTLQSGQRAMRKLVKDPVANKDALIGKLVEMEEAAHAVFAMVPPAPEGMPEERRPSWRIGYQRQMLELIDALLETELAAHAGDAEAIAAGYTKLGEIKKAGHDTYQ